MEVHVLYKELRDKSVAVSGMVRYLETLLKFVKILKNLISADREENWKDHYKLFRIRDQFLVIDTCFLYLEMMQKIPKVHPSIYKVVMK